MALVLAGGSAAIALANTAGEHRIFLAVSNAATVAIFIGVGAFAWSRSPGDGFGKLLLLAGIGWFFVSFSASDSPGLYSVGRVAAWCEEALIVWVFLSYPVDRPETAPARAIAWLAIGTVAVLYLPSVVLLDHFPNPSPYSLCVADCPSNSLQLTGSEPSFVDDFLRPLREVLATSIFLGTAVVIWLRLVRATPLMRRSLSPVLVAAGLGAAAGCVYVGARLVGAGESTLEALAIVRGVAIPMAGLGFVASLLEWQLYEARALERMALSSGAEGIASAELQEVVRGALEDPSADLRFRRERGWEDADGELAELPRESATRCVAMADNAAILCDPALKAHRPLARAAATWVSIASERTHLNDLLARSLRAVEESRRRLATAAATERRRIERDLHDGAQQRLVTMRVQLELIDEELKRDPAAGARRLHELGPSIDGVIEEVRSLARGIYPPLLADAGVVEALRAFATGQAITVRVEANPGLRYPLEVESAVYFCCLEALQNATKHSGAGSVTLAITSEPDCLRFSVSDAGCGFVSNGGAGGAGMTNMRDRIAAVAGRLDIDSEPGRGTTISGRVPARARA